MIRPAGFAPEGDPRLPEIDRLRGLVMVLMALVVTSLITPNLERLVPSHRFYAEARRIQSILALVRAYVLQAKANPGEEDITRFYSLTTIPKTPANPRFIH